MVFFAGIDLGKRKSQILIMTAERKIVEDLKVDNDPKVFARIFRKYKGNIEVAMEACGNAFWVADTLAPLVRKVHIGHPKKIRWIAEARIKSDKIDAKILAELLRVDLFPSIAIPPKRIRDLRELVRGLIRIRRQAARCRNQVHTLLGRQGVAYQRSEVHGQKLATLVREAELPRCARVAAEALLRLEETMLQEEKQLQAEIKRELEKDEEIRRLAGLLESIPGVGYFSALLFVVELWDLSRFKDEPHLASYIGFVPELHQTGETLRNGPMTCQGNVLVRWALVQDAWVARMNHWFFGRVYERHKARKVSGKAIVAVGRRLLKTIYRVWTEQKTYEELYENNKELVG